MEVSGIMGETLTRLGGKFEEKNLTLIVGGGYGLQIRSQWVKENNLTTSFEEIPMARTSNDIDVFLHLEILTSPEKHETIRAIMEELNYVPRPDARNFQFVHRDEVEEDLGRRPKIDLLAENPEDVDEVKLDPPRARSKNASDTIHGRFVEEAINIDQNLRQIPVSFEDMKAPVHLPHPIHYGVLKLFATRDHLEDPDSDAEFQQYHAFDLFMILGLTTEEDWDNRNQVLNSLEGTKQLQKTRSIIEDNFSSESDRGTLALKEFIAENRPAIPDEYIEEFLTDLKELYAI
jgi:hypothetical protein